MAKDKPEQAKQRINATEQSEEVLPGVVPDASAYVIQPTSYKVHQTVQGDLPNDRFTEEVLREEAVEAIADAHPEENRPAPGISGASVDELPDTTGRAVLRNELREDRK